MHNDSTTGSVTGTMLWSAPPMITGDLLQQFYNTADTLVVGRYLEVQALAAIGTTYVLMSFLISILLGLCVGSGTVFPLCYGEKNEGILKSSMFMSLVPVTAVTLVLNTAVFLFTDPIMHLSCVPVEIYGFMREYLWVVFFGINAVFLYNCFACLLRVVGSSFIPLVLLGISTLLNVRLNLVFILTSKWGAVGTDTATTVSQFVSGVGICLCIYLKIPEFGINRGYMETNRKVLAEIPGFSFLTYVQQFVMNFDISAVRGPVNSFGAAIMAAFAATVKTDSFTYMLVQDFGNVFPIFMTQNYGVGRHDRAEKGVESVVTASVLFYLMILSIVYVFARELMFVFAQPQEVKILAVGVQYLRTEGAFYCGIGCLLLLYDLYHAVRKPEMSAVLTVISLEARVVLVYILSAISGIGAVGIWVSVPTGWSLADYTGFAYCWMKCRAILGQGGD